VAPPLMLRICLMVCLGKCDCVSRVCVRARVQRETVLNVINRQIFVTEMRRLFLEAEIESLMLLRGLLCSKILQLFQIWSK
jgi:hypothetical protein